MPQTKKKTTGGDYYGAFSRRSRLPTLATRRNMMTTRRQKTSISIHDLPSANEMRRELSHEARKLYQLAHRNCAKTMISLLKVKKENYA